MVPLNSLLRVKEYDQTMTNLRRSHSLDVLLLSDRASTRLKTRNRGIRPFSMVDRVPTRHHQKRVNISRVSESSAMKMRFGRLWQRSLKLLRTFCGKVVGVDVEDAGDVFDFFILQILNEAFFLLRRV